MIKRWHFVPERSTSVMITVTSCQKARLCRVSCNTWKKTDQVKLDDFTSQLDGESVCLYNCVWSMLFKLLFNKSSATKTQRRGTNAGSYAASFLSLAHLMQTQSAVFVSWLLLFKQILNLRVFQAAAKLSVQSFVYCETSFNRVFFCWSGFDALSKSC